MKRAKWRGKNDLGGVGRKGRKEMKEEEWMTRGFRCWIGEGEEKMTEKDGGAERREMEGEKEQMRKKAKKKAYF